MAQNNFNNGPGGRLKREEAKNAIDFSFLNPKNWGVKDYSESINFSSAYKEAKKSGEDEFMWQGERYNTKYAGTPRQEVGAYGIKGKPLSKKQIEDVASISVFPPLSKEYLPGHMAASIGNNITSVDYSSRGNKPFGSYTGQRFRKGGDFYNIYGVDKEKFVEKAASLPSNHPLINSQKKNDWNLFTNNCADNVCDAIGIERSKGITTPWGAMNRAKEKYPSIETTGRTRDDYKELADALMDEAPNKVISQAKNILGIASSPDLRDRGDDYASPSTRLVRSLQVALSRVGYKLPSSLSVNEDRTGVTYDGIFGPETKAALEDYQKKTSQPSNNRQAAIVALEAMKRK
jgi:hypothetical protein